METYVKNGKNIEDISTPCRVREMEMVKALAVVDSKGDTPVRITWRMSRSTTALVVHCSVWANGHYHYGNAGGYGYDKLSAAFADALYKAGYKVRGLSGAGDYAIREAALQLARLDKKYKRRKLSIVNFG